jgi:hypothetical protein
MFAEALGFRGSPELGVRSLLEGVGGKLKAQWDFGPPLPQGMDRSCTLRKSSPWVEEQAALPLPSLPWPGLAWDQARGAGAQGCVHPYQLLLL